jgi:hypothetical protein
VVRLFDFQVLISRGSHVFLSYCLEDHNNKDFMFIEYLLTAWSNDLFVKLIVAQVIDEYLSFYKIRGWRHYSVKKSPALDPILSQNNGVDLTPCLL